jgi:hypothetical protein
MRTVDSGRAMSEVPCLRAVIKLFTHGRTEMTPRICRNGYRKHPRIASVTLVIVAFVATTGCSALMNTRVQYPDPSIDTTCDAASGGWRTVKGSLGCAAVVRNDMDERAGLQSKIPRVIGTILIPLTASIAGLAITGTTGAPITALTLGGTALMGEGFWLSSPARRQAYSVGAGAVQCVITTTRSLAYRDDPDFPTFRDNARSLTGKMLDVNRKISEVNAALANVPGTPADERAAIQEEIAAAQEVVTTAKLVRSRAETAITRMNGAAGEIHGSVDRIIRLVNDEIDKSEPTMELVRQAVTQQIQSQTSALKGLEALVADAAAKAEAAEAKRKKRTETRATNRETRLQTEAEVKLEAALDRAREELSDAVRNPATGLSAVTHAVNDKLDLVGTPLPAEGCVTTAQGTVGAKPLEIVISPEDPVTAGQTVTVLVAGGVGDVRINADPAAQARLEIETTIVSGVRRVVVKVKAGTPDGTYLIDVTDTLSSKVVKIVVKA